MQSSLAMFLLLWEYSVIRRHPTLYCIEYQVCWWVWLFGSWNGVPCVVQCNWQVSTDLHNSSLSLSFNHSEGSPGLADMSLKVRLQVLWLTPSSWNPSTYVVEGWPMLCTITLSLCHIVNILLSLNAIVISAIWQFQTPVHRTQIQSWLTTELHRITPLKAEELNMLTHHKVLASMVVFLCVDASV